MNNDDAKNTLEQILEKYEILLKTIETEGSNNVSFARGQLNRDIGTIYEVFTENISRTDYDEILHLVKRNYKLMYPERGSLTEYYIWRVDPYERAKANKPLIKVDNELKVIFDNIN